MNYWIPRSSSQAFENSARLSISQNIGVLIFHTSSWKILLPRSQFDVTIQANLQIFQPPVYSRYIGQCRSPLTDEYHRRDRRRISPWSILSKLSTVALIKRIDNGARAEEGRGGRLVATREFEERSEKSGRAGDRGKEEQKRKKKEKEEKEEGEEKKLQNGARESLDARERDVGCLHPGKWKGRLWLPPVCYHSDLGRPLAEQKGHRR